MNIHDAPRLPRRAFSIACVLALVVVAAVRVPALSFLLGPGPPQHLRTTVETALADAHVVEKRLRVLGYERSLFGSGWAMTVTEDGDYLSTRELMLLKAQRAVPSGEREGRGLDDYTGEAVVASEIEIDHIVPLAAAWDLGAYAWDSTKRRRFANDVDRNLAATFSSLNREKSDATLSHWVPPDKDRQCAYAARYLTVIVDYGLALPQEDADAARQLCRIH